MEIDKKNFILNEIKFGNEDAFRAFFKAEFNNLSFFIFKYVKDIELAKDIAQESFLAFWDKRESLNPENNIRAFLFTIARNKSLNFLKSYSYRKDKIAESIDDRERLLSIESLQYDSVLEILEAIELEEIINNVYQNLPLKIRESFILSRDKGMTYEQIAEIKGISIKVVEYHISLALKVFKKKLNSYLRLLF
ncbi:MAG: RNA polymerase sigma-70 factor [Bacteroidales bacterium]|jgi:RNA polymerase sigma-70 factor (ECF subfamily)